EPVDASPSGRLLEGVIEVIDEFYSANLSQDTVRGMRENAGRGFRNGGTTPYGYQKAQHRVGSHAKSTLTPDPVEAAIVKRIFRLCLGGLGLKEIAKRLNDDGVRTRAGLAWGKNALHYLLTNEVYAGTLVFRLKNKGARDGGALKDPVRV